MKKRMEKVSKEKGKEVEEEPSHTAGCFFMFNLNLYTQLLF